MNEVNRKEYRFWQNTCKLTIKQKVNLRRGLLKTKQIIRKSAREVESIGKKRLTIKWPVL